MLRAVDTLHAIAEEDPDAPTYVCLLYTSLRRLTRDYTQRGADAVATLSRWGSVRRGEEKHIFPYQENRCV